MAPRLDLMNANEIVEMLQAWVQERTGAPVDPGLRFAQSELLDSFDVMELVVFSETRFKVNFSASDFANPDFATLAGLARVIHSRV
jgi:acyl carrier protein